MTSAPRLLATCIVALALAACASVQGNPAPDTDEERAEPALTVLGKTFAVPEGCRRDPRAPTRAIVCGASDFFLAWSRVDDEARGRATLDQFEEDSLQHAREIDPKARRDSVSCTVAGTPTTCRRIRLAPGRQTMTHLMAYAQRDGEGVLISCTALHETGAAVPCTLIFDVE